MDTFDLEIRLANTDPRMLDMAARYVERQWSHTPLLTLLMDDYHGTLLELLEWLEDGLCLDSLQIVTSLQMQYGFDCDAQLMLQSVSKVQVFPLDGHNTKQGEYGGPFGGIKTIGH